jgi:hypothetical protein
MMRGYGVFFFETYFTPGTFSQGHGLKGGVFAALIGDPLESCHRVSPYAEFPFPIQALVSLSQ